MKLCKMHYPAKSVLVESAVYDQQWSPGAFDGDKKMLNRFSSIQKKVLSFSQKQIRNMQMMTALIAFIYMSLFVYQSVYGIPSARSNLQVNWILNLIAIVGDRKIDKTGVILIKPVVM